MTTNEIILAVAGLISTVLTAVGGLMAVLIRERRATASQAVKDKNAASVVEHTETRSDLNALVGVIEKIGRVAAENTNVVVKRMRVEVKGLKREMRDLRGEHEKCREDAAHQTALIATQEEKIVALEDDKATQDATIAALRVEIEKLKAASKAA